MLKYQTNQAASWEHLYSMFKNTDFYLIAYQLKLIISLTQIEVLVKKKMTGYFRQTFLTL